ncbi:MAG TPA: YdeI/OmpD-associated family protein [Dokdonella sp.]
MNSDARIDAYIAKSAPFAQPILAHLRKVLHEACPEVEETIKWSMPFFLLDGRPFANMAAFKQHCAFGFWKARQVVGEERSDEAMGQFGRLTSLSELPSKKRLSGYVRKAVEQHRATATAPRARASTPRPPAEVPEDLAAALKKSAKARKTFEAFSPSHRREYIDWIIEAKREETRAKRLATTIEWLVEGKARNWKYANC